MHSPMGNRQRPLSRPLISAEVVVLFDWLGHRPSAVETGGKLHQVSGGKLCGLAILGGHRHLPFQQQADFFLVVIPREGAHLTGPDRPITDTQGNDHALRAWGGHLDRHFTTPAMVQPPSLRGALPSPAIKPRCQRPT